MTSASRLRAILAGALLLTGCQAIQGITSRAEAPGPVPLTSLAGVAEAMRDTIAERLATLEIERATMLASRNAQSPEVTALSRQRGALCRELTELQRTITVESFATARVLRAVEERLAGLAVDRALALTRRTAESPEVRALDRMIVELQRRRTHLRGARTGGELRACV